MGRIAKIKKKLLVNIKKGTQMLQGITFYFFKYICNWIYLLQIILALEYPSKNIVTRENIL